MELYIIIALGIGTFVFKGSAIGFLFDEEANDITSFVVGTIIAFVFSLLVY